MSDSSRPIQPVRKKRVTIHVVSDSTGGLAQHMVGAILTQFPDLDAKMEFHPFRDTEEKIRETIDRFKKRSTVVLHALVDPHCKSLVGAACGERGVPHYDLTGSLAQFLADHTQIQPENDLMRLHRTDEGYFQRVDALEFTLQHDDSRRLESVHEADVVLIGLSRVSKTPTSVLLGAFGYKAANVSIVGGRYPTELSQCKKQIVALTMTPKQLHEIRSRRFELNQFSNKMDELGGDDFGYLNLRDIVHEVAAAEVRVPKTRLPDPGHHRTDRGRDSCPCAALAEYSRRTEHSRHFPQLNGPTGRIAQCSAGPAAPIAATGRKRIRRLLRW